MGDVLKVSQNKKKLLSYFILFILLLIFNVLIGKHVIDSNFPMSSNVSIFVIINLNLLLLLILFVVIFRNIAKLFLDRRSNVFGSKLKTKLIIFSTALTAIPVMFLFILSYTMINKSIDKWFDTQIELALKNSSELVQNYQSQMENELVEQSKVVSQLITSKGLFFQQNYKELKNFVEEFMDGKRIDGLALYNSHKIMLLAHDSSNIISKVIDDKRLDKSIEGKIEAKYVTIGNSQIYLAVLPVKSSMNEATTSAVLVVYKRLTQEQIQKASKILQSYYDYRQLKSFSLPIKNSYKILLLLMTILVIFSGIWGSILFAKNITESLEKLAYAAHQVAKGDLDIAIERVGDDEIGVLIDSFNDMTRKLSLHHYELNQKNVELSEMFMQISKDNQYIETFFKYNKSAIFLFDEKLNILKVNAAAKFFVDDSNNLLHNFVFNNIHDFLDSNNKEKNIQIDINVNGELRTYVMSNSKIYNNGKIENVICMLDDISDVIYLQRINIWKEIATKMAHEIKNPLTPIKLSAERILKKHKIIQDEQFRGLIHESMNTIINEVNELHSLVTEFNDFARLPQMKKEHFDICEVIKSILFMYRQSNPDIDFNVKCNNGLILHADRSQMRRVFINLLNNAVHAVSGHGEIKILIVSDNNFIIVEFEDNGSGISEEDISKVFIPYFSKKSEGTGLGLAIVKKIIDEHGGTIKVESELGKYTKFIFKIPMDE